MGIIIYYMMLVAVFPKSLYKENTTLSPFVSKEIIIQPTSVNEKLYTYPYKGENSKECERLQNDNANVGILAWGNAPYYYYGARLTPQINNGYPELIFCKLEYLFSTCEVQYPLAFVCTTWVCEDNSGSIGQRKFGFYFDMPQIPPGQIWTLSLDIEAFNIHYPNAPFWLLAGSNITNGDVYAPLVCLDNNGGVASRNIFWASGSWAPVSAGDVMFRALVKYAPAGEEEEIRGRSVELKVYPNPSTKWTSIRYSGEKTESTKLRLKIYDLAGRKIKEFQNLPLEGRVLWDRKDNSGKDISSGSYLISLEGATTKITKRVNVLH